MYADQKLLRYIQGRQIAGEQTLLIDDRIVEFPGGSSLIKCRRATVRELVENGYVAIGPMRDVWVTMSGVERMKEEDNTIQKNYRIPVEAEGELDAYVKELKRKYGR
jgi:hypothetical protein